MIFFYIEFSLYYLYLIHIQLSVYSFTYKLITNLFFVVLVTKYLLAFLYLFLNSAL